MLRKRLSSDNVGKPSNLLRTISNIKLYRSCTVEMCKNLKVHEFINSLQLLYISLRSTVRWIHVIDYKGFSQFWTIHAVCSHLQKKNCIQRMKFLHNHLIDTVLPNRQLAVNCIGFGCTIKSYFVLTHKFYSGFLWKVRISYDN